MSFGGPPSIGTATALGTPTTSFTDPKRTNPPFTSHHTHVIPTDPNVQRGYMRLLGQVLQANLGHVGESQREQSAEAALNELGAKLDFQFNPNQLVRSVTARTDTQLWINQSPSELLTPGLGDMSFSWQMLFNREEEVQRYYNARGRWSKAGYRAEGANDLSLDALLEDPSEPLVAERIGVLADIMVMDEITGQRLTKAAIEFSKKWALVRPEDGEDVSPEEPISDERQQSLLDANLTNSAFLIPNPIRVVFSENFMVDGYVNTVAVSIQKFSPDMVPIVCTVDISMHALYQGFARRSTVFTALANQIEEDTGPPGDNNPYGGESAFEEATNAADATTPLQEQGMQGTGILAGLDHSPSQTSGDDGHTKLEYYRAKVGHPKTKNLPDSDVDGDTDFLAPKGGTSLHIQLRGSNETAFEYGIVSNLKDSGLGHFLHREQGSDDDAQRFFDEIKHRFQVVGYVGVALRARLKAESLASLQELWTDGAQNGFSSYWRGQQNYTAGHWQDATQIDDHFFDRWPPEQRRQLFAVGIDSYKMGLTGTVNQSLSNGNAYNTNNQSSGFYTRSFPIIELSEMGFPGFYGDIFRMDDFEYGPDQINADIGNSLDEGWVWCGDYDGGNRINGGDWKFPIARGFYDPATGVPFPEYLYLRDKNSPHANLHRYEIEYQQAVTLRVRLNMTKPAPASGTLVVSDTGVLWVHPMSEAMGTIKDVDGKGLIPDGVHGAVNPQGHMRGVDGDGIQNNMMDMKWITAHGTESINDHMFYDGLYNHPGDNKKHENVVIYGHFSKTNPNDPSLGGMRISSQEILANNKNIELP